MKYTITVEPKGVGHTIKETQTNKEMEAIKIAKEWVEENKEHHVYVSFYRASDGQTGYINPDGAGISGKDWAENQ
jgi:hypothetical protein